MVTVSQSETCTNQMIPGARFMLGDTKMECAFLASLMNDRHAATFKRIAGLISLSEVYSKLNNCDYTTTCEFMMGISNIFSNRKL